MFDGHNDTLLRLRREKLDGSPSSFLERGERGHLDLSRAREGGLGGGLFAVHMPPDPATAPSLSPPEPGSIPNLDLPEALEWTYAQRFALSVAEGLFRIEAESGGEVCVVRNAREIRNCLASGVLAAALHFEGAEPIEPTVHRLETYYEMGLRSLGLVWSRPNRYAEGVPFRFGCSADTGPGLSADGRDLVKECNRLGVLVDLAHLNERGFWDVAHLSDAPLVASHSNAYALCRSTRNLTDAQLDAVKDSRGIVGVNFSVTFLREDGRWLADTPMEYIVRHIDYLVERMGIDHVGFGSDFDGATIPTELVDVTGIPRLMALLADRGYDDIALRKLAHENWLRVLEATWKG